jgi:hypothetical protein
MNFAIGTEYSGIFWGQEGKGPFSSRDPTFFFPLFLEVWQILGFYLFLRFIRLTNG